jgi:hypothetical protein
MWKAQYSESPLSAAAEEEGQEEYLLALESSDMANLSADVSTLGFQSGAGISPGRLLRVSHALTRAILMTLSGCAASHLNSRNDPASLAGPPCVASCEGVGD